MSPWRRPTLGKLRWYKRDPVAALEGMSDLTLEEKGAYNTVLDLIYARDGKVDDDDRFIAGWLRCDVRVWRRIKSTLVDKGKLYLEQGSIRNSRADAEVSRGLSLVASASEAGKASARSRKVDDNKPNDLAATPVETTVPTNSTTTSTSTPELRSGPRAKRARARAPLPDDWSTSIGDIAHARERGFTDQQIHPMARAFANHHRAKGNMMADWGAAWRTWCENEIKFQGNRSSPNGNGKSVVAAQDRLNAKISEFSEPDLLGGVRREAGASNVRLLPSGRGG